jgi:hypothetical protein
MSMFICRSCGIQYAESSQPPSDCAVCRADACFEPMDPPAWTTLDAIRRTHTNLIQRLEPNLFSVRSIPSVGGGHRALLLRTERGNILWGCVTLVDEATVRAIRALGGVSAIAVSHPRHFATMIEWSHAFGSIPIHVHATGRRWLMRPDHVVRYWGGAEQELFDGATLVHVGTGVGAGTLLHWQAAAAGGGALLTGDVVQVLKHRRGVGLLSSSRDLVPRSGDGVRQLVSAIARFRFEALYDAQSDSGITRNARAIVLESSKRYLAALSGLHEVSDPRCWLIA